MLHVIASETYLQLLRDPAHWGLELTIEAVTGALLYPAGRFIVRRWLARHDAIVHGKEHG